MFDKSCLRMYFGLTLKDVANAAGVTEGCVTRYEKGNYKSSRCDEVYNSKRFAELRREKYGDFEPVISFNKFKEESL